MNRIKKPYEASLDLVQLQAVMPEGDAGLAAIEEALQTPEMEKAMRDDRKRYEAYLASQSLNLLPLPEKTGDDGAEWRELVSQGSYRQRAIVPNNPLPEPTTWRMKVIESISKGANSATHGGLNVTLEAKER